MERECLILHHMCIKWQEILLLNYRLDTILCMYVYVLYYYATILYEEINILFTITTVSTSTFYFTYLDKKCDKLWHKNLNILYCNKNIYYSVFLVNNIVM